MHGKKKPPFPPAGMPPEMMGGPAPLTGKGKARRKNSVKPKKKKGAKTPPKMPY